MKRLPAILFLFFSSFAARAQDDIEGQLLLKNKTINTHSRIFNVTVYADHKYITSYVDSMGRFKIDRQKVIELGPLINFSVGMSSTFLHYADFELLEIPIDSIDIFLSKVYLTKAYVNWRCGDDCYKVNNIRTYWKRKYFVDNGQVKYRVNRTPKKGLSNDPLLDVKYQTNVRKDVLR